MQTKITFAVAALIAKVSAASPDVYGPNGDNYSNVSPSQEMADIGISISE